jgi:hypothetical protein
LYYDPSFAVNFHVPCNWKNAKTQREKMTLLYLCVLAFSFHFAAKKAQIQLCQTYQKKVSTV